MRAILPLLGGVLVLLYGITCFAAADIPDNTSVLQQVFVEGISDPIGLDVDAGRLPASSGPVLWQFRYSRANVRYVRFHFTRISAPEAAGAAQPFAIRIIESTGNILATYPAEEFRAGDTFSTGLLPPGDLRVQLVAEAPPTFLRFTLDSATVPRWDGQVRLQSILPHYREVDQLPADARERTTGKAVARLTIARPPNGPADTTCTGVLVAPDIVATNYHCLDKSGSYRHARPDLPTVCQDIVAEFNYLQQDGLGPSGSCQSVPLARTMEGRKLMKDADIALLRFRPIDIADTTGPRQPAAIASADMAGQTVLLLHHPLGRPLSFQRECNLVDIANAREAHHDCDTDPGSSGAPLFDGSMNVIGLHFEAAFPEGTTRTQEMQYRQEHGATRFNVAKRAALLRSMLQRLKEEPSP